MLAKASNDCSTPTRKDSCRSNSCGSACLRYASANRRSALSCRRSLTKPMIGLHSCAWPKPSRHSLRACAVLPKRLDVAERQRIVRLVVKDVLVGEDDYHDSPQHPDSFGPTAKRGFALARRPKLPFV